MTTPIWSPHPVLVPATQRTAFENFVREFGRLPVGMILHEWPVTDLDGFRSAVWGFYGVVGENGAVTYRESVLPEAV